MSWLWWLAALLAALLVYEFGRIPWYVARCLWSMKRLLEKGEGVRVTRICREAPGRYRIDAEGWGEKQSLWGMWVPWENQIRWHYQPTYMTEEPNERAASGDE